VIASMSSAGMFRCLVGLSVGLASLGFGHFLEFLHAGSRETLCLCSPCSRTGSSHSAQELFSKDLLAPAGSGSKRG
jgi:hypothetical protein